MKHGTFLVFEGLDGSGKSTQLGLLAAALRELGRDVLETSEPWEGSRWGRRIREMARSGEAPAPTEELHWFLEQRRDHLREVIEPALAAGRVVLSDRYILSTVAYQGARGLDAGQLLANGEAEFPLPDLVVLLEIDAAEGLRRVSGRGAPAEPVFEKAAFLERVAENFAAIERDYLVRIDASQPAEDVHAEILKLLQRRSLLHEALA